MNRIRALLGVIGIIPVVCAQNNDKPNIVIIYTDDMGMGDLSCYNDGWVRTPCIDSLAANGIKFNNYYTASPVSSPSRVALTTGMFPLQWGINTFLHERSGNAKCEQLDYLNDSAPTISKSLKKVGYVTAHIGKWHMGGGRDVDDAPQITSYGFDEYVSTYESPDPDKLITASDWIWSKQDSIKRWERTGYFVDKALDFLERHKGEPCFVNLWPDDMHDPWIPEYDYFDDNASWKKQQNFVSVLKEYDKQIGRFVEGLKRIGEWDNTLIIFTSDNGALPTFNQMRTNGMRGAKVSLYEGGIRMPFIVCWPQRIKAGKVDDRNVLSAVDIYPSLCAITGAKLIDGFDYSGEEMSKVLLGISSQIRKKELMWDYGRNPFFGRPPQKYHQSPHLAIRKGDYKLLINSDGTCLELYDIVRDPNETVNIASHKPELCDSLTKKLLDWYNSKKVTRQSFMLHNKEGYYQNPIIDYSLPDPSIIKSDDGYYYLYATESIRNLPIHRSKNLVDWEYVGTAFTKLTRPSFEKKGGLWAPDINKIGNKYVLYYSMSVWGGEWTCGIGCAISDNPEGPFIDNGKLFRSNEINVQNSIDPFYIEDNGRKYLFWGSFRGIYGIELSDDGLAVRKGAIPQQIAGTAYEGSYIYKRNGYYYLFASIGTCCDGLKSTYKTVVGRSKHLWGPYLDRKGNNMLNNYHEILMHSSDKFVGTGHNSEIVTDAVGNDWLFYHAVSIEHPEGRVLMLDKLNWRDGWPYIEGNIPSVEAEIPQF